jgi:hypothetical protein
MIKEINLPCVFCGGDRTTILSKIKFNSRDRLWASSSCPNCQVKYIQDRELKDQMSWWSADKIKKAIELLEKHQGWEKATKEFDSIFGTSYDQSARRSNKGYRSALNKKFEYMPEVDWIDSEDGQVLIDRVINAMSEEKKRRGIGRLN